jgi:hypothetical protein
MRKSVVKHAWVLFAVLAVGLLFFNSSLVKLSAQQQRDKKPDLPTLDYETEVNKAVGQDHKNRGARFRDHGNPGNTKHITELPNGVVPLPTNDHSLVRLPALPVAQSDVIIAGKIIDAQAHLSDDRTGIYSEFLTEVSEVLKDNAKSVSVGSTVSAARTGGAVRFASGKVQEYRIADQGVPTKGKSYVLFLKREEGGDFTILTGYELSNNGLVTPLDNENSTMPFAYYRDASESQFLQDLRAAIQRGGDK